MFESLYIPYAHEIDAFGSAWCGPETYPQREDVLVARYDAPEGGDGQTVEVFGHAAPARFYKIRVLVGANSCGDPLPAYELCTGSSMAKLAADIGQAIADGMLALTSTPAAQ
jgi:hypothetical protein